MARYHAADGNKLKEDEARIHTRPCETMAIGFPTRSPPVTRSAAARSVSRYGPFGWLASRFLHPDANDPGPRGRGRTGADTAGDVALGVLWFAPDLLVHGAIGAAHTAAHLPGAVAGLAGAAPEAAANLAGAAGEAAGGIFESIAGIIAGIFEMLDFG